MSDDKFWMSRAIRLAKRGEGFVEPNPMVGCVLVRDGQPLGAGWHARFGGPHAEVAAIENAKQLGRCDSDGRLAGATAYVSLEPCCHHGKTPPCSLALIEAGISRVVIAHRDPFPRVDGGGIQQLSEAGIEVVLDVEQEAAASVLAPYLKCVNEGMPWMIAKWAMTLDGRIASRTHDSQWISNESSRSIVHQIRGRVDGIMVGSGTAEADDPRLTARPPGARLATRIVVDSQATLSPSSNLAKTADDIPVLLFASENADQDKISKLQAKGIEVVAVPREAESDRITLIMKELRRRQMTNVLVEGGGGLLGALNDAQQINEWHVFIAMKIVGGEQAVPPVKGDGLLHISDAAELVEVKRSILGDDVYISGRTAR